MKIATPNNLVNVSKHINSKLNRINTLFSINELGLAHYIKNNIIYTVEEFEKEFPIVQVKKNTNENIDGTRNWLT